MNAHGSFVYPEFWSYPPYFTLQPIPETQNKQKQLWRALILAYCKHHRIFQVDVQEFPPFSNPAINRHLSQNSRRVLLEDLVKNNQGQWLDLKSKSACLVLWRSVSDWASTLYSWALNSGLKDSVVTIDELMHGDYVKGTELEGIHVELLLRIIKELEMQGRAKLFKGTSQDDEGVKFF